MTALKNDFTFDDNDGSRFNLVPFAKLEARHDRSYLVKGVIPREGLVVVWGPPKSGKSFWTFDLMMHVALGREYRDRRVTQGAVVYVCCEGERGIGARAQAFRAEKISDSQTVVPFYLVATRLDLAADHKALIKDIYMQVGDGGCAAVVIDTLNRSLVGSESRDEDMGNYIRATDAIRETFNCAVIVVHHCGIESGRPRGHSSLTGACDAQIEVSSSKGVITAKVEHMKDGEAGAEVFCKLKIVDLGQNEDGDPVTSCVVDVADGAALKGARSKKLSPATRNALDQLRRALTKDGRIPPTDSHIPANKATVSEDVWRRYCDEGQISAGATADAKRKAFKRAADALQVARIIGVWNGQIWLVA